jgi:phenylacetate-coenzyme A ligase PaaK-like adenylate-forming protein
MDPALPQDILEINNSETFRETALKVFLYQAEQNEVYNAFLHTLGIEPRGIAEVEQIPFLPVEFFKTHRVICKGKEPEIIFESSGTTGSAPALHYVADADLYMKSFTEGFRHFYGNPERYCILALLPSYLERQGSSLVHMMDLLIRQSAHPDSGFYLQDLEALVAILRKRTLDGHPTLLLGVSFALLDLAEEYPMELGEHIIVMETGGMKGRRKELIRAELHSILQEAFNVPVIHSEYGMSELLSQGYSKGEGFFRTPAWMKVLVRDANDPLTLVGPGQSGGLNIIDLANLYSCSFIATGDLGKVHEDGSFEVLGRFDHADVRGCNLLVT